MSRWQRKARFLIAVFAIAFAVVVALAFKRRAPASSAQGVVRTDPVAIVETTGGRVERFKLSHEDVRVEYDKQLTYADGSTKMQGVRINTDDRAGGRSFTVSGKEGQVGKDESTIVLNGDVRLVASDGMTARTEHATYSDADGMLKAPGPVEVSKGRMSGVGTGMTWDKARDVLWIDHDAVVHIKKDEKGVGATEITSASAGFARRDKYMRFEGGTHVERDGQIIDATTAVAHLTDDERHIETLELRENARVRSPRPTPGGLQALSGNGMDLKYRVDGETLEHALVSGNADIQVAGEAGKAGRQITANVIDITLAEDGATPTGLAARDSVQLTLPAEGSAPARTVRAATMEATGEGGKGITQARFRDNVQYREKGAAVDRGANAAQLDLTMKPGMGAMEDARFAHGVRFVDGKLTARAAAARYDLEKGTLALTGSEPGAVTPHVVTDQIVVDATRMDITLVGPQVKAVGAVKSVLQPAKDAGAKRPSMLKADQPANITADALDYDSALSKAVYTGAALLWQAETSVKGATITLDNNTGDLSAAGTIATTAMLEDVDKNKKMQRVRSVGTAKDFKYEDALRRATYTGDAHLTGPEGDLTADKIDLYLKPGGQEIDRLEGYDKVTIRDPNRKSTGLRLTYTTSDERYVVTGTPVTVVDECGRETIGKTLTYFKNSDTIVIDGNEQSRTQTKGGGKCP